MAKSQTVTKTQSSDWDGNGVIDSRAVFTTTTDKAGNRTFYNEKYDYNVDGDFDSEYTIETTFNKANQPTKVVSTSDWDGDGVLNDRTVTDSVYKKGLLVEETTRSDSGADGTIDWENGVVNTYDKAGNLTLRLQLYDWGGDGNGSENGWDNADRFEYVYTNGQLTHEQWDYGSNGTIDGSVDYVYT